MGRVTVQLHARAVDLAGERETGVEIGPEATAEDVKRALAAAHPALDGLLASCAIATEDSYLADGAAVGAENRLHLIPPVSGG